jgi:cell division protein FtsI/penicillin-binding protein 2
MNLFKKKEKKIKLTPYATLFGRNKPLNVIKKNKTNKNVSLFKPKKKLLLNTPKKKKVNLFTPKKPNTSIILNKVNKSNNKYLDSIIETRYLFITIIIFILFGGISLKLFQLQILNNSEYSEQLLAATENTIEGSSAPRGRIYDRNHNLIVDNEAIKTIYYKKESGVTTLEEIDLAYKVANLIEVDYSKLTDKILKDFWYASNTEEAKKKITSEEKKQYSERKLDDDDLEDLIYERITEEDLSIYNDLDKEAAYIYYLMNKGYSYAEKVIKNVSVTDEEYALISENIDDLGGFNTKVDWERTYPYGDTFKSILGSVSSSNQGIPSELKDYYLNKGYSLDDRVGISYLEYQYEDYLRGTKSVYKVLSDNSYELVSEGVRGNDLVLTIDIELQQYLEEVLTKEVLAAKKENNTEYFDHSFVVVSDPNTGEILAMAGKQVVENDDGTYKVVDYTPGVVTTSVTPGSIVKGASMLVGYKYGAISIGEYLVDECIKIKSTPEKCSWKTLGKINDLDALAYSSNVYQYKIAIRVGGGTYKYDESLSLDTSAFDKYREMYNSFGLGVKTGIDLPNESLGYAGSSTLPGHLLDFAIGQYDTYTPIQISQYINTLANGGTRYQPYLLKEVYKSSDTGESFSEKIYEATSVAQGTVDVDSKYMDRVHEGFRAVVTYGIGNGYMGNYDSISAGKTGTSQSFIDTDGDGVVDTETISTSFIGYAPYDNPKMTIAVLSPDIDNGESETTSRINRRISSQIVNKFFEIYG